MNAFLQNFLDWQLLTGSLPALLETGLVNTLVLSLFSTLLGIIAGMVLALMAVSAVSFICSPMKRRAEWMATASRVRPGCGR